MVVVVPVTDIGGVDQEVPPAPFWQLVNVPWHREIVNEVTRPAELVLFQARVT